MTNTSYPVPGDDGHAYLCIWDDRREWHSDRAVACATDAKCIVQRCMRGRHRGEEWTVRGGLV